MKAVSEVFSTVLLTLVSVVLASILAASLVGAVTAYTAQLRLQAGAHPCVARPVAVANESGRAVIYLYNVGMAVCAFDRLYLLRGGSAAASIHLAHVEVAPGAVLKVETEAPYGPYRYRLTGPHGEAVEAVP